MKNILWLSLPGRKLKLAWGKMEMKKKGGKEKGENYKINVVKRNKNLSFWGINSPFLTCLSRRAGSFVFRGEKKILILKL